MPAVAKKQSKVVAKAVTKKSAAAKAVPKKPADTKTEVVKTKAVKKRKAKKTVKNMRLLFSRVARKMEGCQVVGDFKEADVHHSMTSFPLPWKDSTVSAVVISHMVECIESTKDYKKFWRELYRICQPDAKISIIATYPYHDHFQGDPSCVRPFLPRTAALLSKTNNKRWREASYVCTYLAEELDVDFELVNGRFGLDPVWAKHLDEKKITDKELPDAIRTYNNVAQEVYVDLKVIK